MSRAPSTSTLMGGFRVLGVAIRREPWVFTLSTLGSVLFGALTVADAWVLGWSTDNVVLPAFETGTTTTKGLVTIFALFLGVAILRAVGIVARRLGAGIMQYRMQAHYRREVTRRYLDLPMSWHQRHPTGELLSNANSDVEAAWAPIAPLPMAVGTLAMMVIAILQMLLTDLAMALIGLLVFPLVMLVNVVFQRLSSPIFTRIQALRAELSEIAHESFDGAMVVKTLGREGEETDRFAAKARDLRDEGIRAGRIRAAFDPFLESLPNLGVLAVLGVGVLRVQSGAAEPGDVVTVAYLLTIVAFPIRSIGWLLGEFPRSVVGYTRVRSVLDTVSETTYGDAKLAAASPGRRARRRRPRLQLRVRPTPAGRPGLHPRARPDRGRGRRDCLRQEHAHLAGHQTGRPAVGVDPGRRPGPARPRPRTAGPARGTGAAERVPVRRHGARQRDPRRGPARRGDLGGAAHRTGRRVRGRAAEGPGQPAR